VVPSQRRNKLRESVNGRRNWGDLSSDFKKKVVANMRTARGEDCSHVEFKGTPNVFTFRKEGTSPVETENRERNDVLLFEPGRQDYIILQGGGGVNDRDRMIDQKKGKWKGRSEKEKG